MEIYEYIGKCVREHRGERRTQAQLAEDAGLTRSTIANLELGRQQVPLEQLVLIARALKIDYRDLLPPPELLPVPGIGPVTAETVRERAPETASFIDRLQEMRPNDDEQKPQAGSQAGNS